MTPRGVGGREADAAIDRARRRCGARWRRCGEWLDGTGWLERRRSCHREPALLRLPPPFAAILSPPARFLREILMQQRQLRLGDILDDYCPRERRVTNHAVVAMVGADVKQTRCSTCDAEHEYKHAKVPRQRRKSETPAALYAQVPAGAPKRVAHERRRRATRRRSRRPRRSTRPRAGDARRWRRGVGRAAEPMPAPTPDRRRTTTPTDDDDAEARGRRRPGASAADSRVAAAARRAAAAARGRRPSSRSASPAAGPNRFRPRAPAAAGSQFQGNRSNGNTAAAASRGGGMPRPGGGGRRRAAGPARPGRKRSS